MDEQAEKRPGDRNRKSGVRRDLRAAAIGGLAATFVVAAAFAPKLLSRPAEVKVHNSSTESALVESTTTAAPPETTTTEAPTTTTATAPVVITTTTTMAPMPRPPTTGSTMLVTPTTMPGPDAPRPITNDVHTWVQMTCLNDCSATIQVMSNNNITNVVVIGHVGERTFTLSIPAVGAYNIGHDRVEHLPAGTISGDVVIDDVTWYGK